MVICKFENGGEAKLRHVVTHAIVEKDGAILLVKRAPGLLEAGKWGLPAGYMELNETAAESVLRELYEETGWEGTVSTFFRIVSTPNRPNEDRQNVSLEFIVTPTKKTGTPDHESTDVQWIPIDKLRPNEFAFDHGESIQLYLKWKEKKFQLPMLI